MTNAGESINLGLLLKSRCVFKIFLECPHRGFPVLLRRTPLGNPVICWGNKPCFQSVGEDSDFTGEKSSRILEVDSVGEKSSEIETLAGGHPMKRNLGGICHCP